MSMRPGQAKGPSVASISGGGGGGSVTSSFTAGNIPVASSTTNLANSVMSQVAGNIVVAGGMTISTTLGVTGVTTLTDLAGSGTRMVVASATGVLSTQAIPASGSLADPTGTIGLTAVNGVLTTALRSDGAPALSQAIVPTWSGIHTFTLQPVMSSLTASLPVFSDGSKGLVSNAMTGTGNVVMSASPTLTGTIGAASMTLSASLTVGTTLGVTGISTFTAQPIFSSVTASTAAAFDSSKGLVSVTNTGTGNNVLSASPTLTGTITAAAMTLSASLTVGTTLGVTGVSTFTDLAGSGTRMVVASATGVLSTQSIPAGASLADPTGTIGLTAVNGVLTSGMRSDGAPALSQAIVPTWSGIHTFSVAPVFSTSVNRIMWTNGSGALGSTSALAYDGTTITVGIGNTINAATGAATWTSAQTFTAQPIFSSVTASTAAAFDSSKGLVSVTNTGTGNNVLSASPTLTGTIAAASMTLSGTLGVTGVTTLNATGSGLSSALVTSAAAPTATWVVTGAGSNEKVWDLAFAATTMSFRTRTDAHGAGVDWMQVTRSGTGASTLKLDIDNISTSSILVLNGSKLVVGGTGTNGAIGSITVTTTASVGGVLTLNASGTGLSSALVTSAAAPTATWVVTGAGSNEKVWDLAFAATTMSFRTRTDAHGAGVDWMQVTRSGTGASTLKLDIDNISTSSILVLNGSKLVVAGTGTSGFIGSIVVVGTASVGGILTHIATISTDVALTSASGALAVDAALADNFTCTLSENTTVSAPTNPAAGRTIRFRFKQAAGNYTLAWNAVFDAMGSTIQAITTTSGKFGYYAFKWNEDSSKWDYLGATVYVDS